MAPFGFTPPENSDNSENPDNGMPDFSALFEQLGISPENLKDFKNLGFLSGGNPATTEFTFPIGIARDIAKKFVSSQSLLPIGKSDLTQIHEAM